MKIIDLRSDTVTRPTPEMREAMKNAVVGDDILRDDPTVIELEELAADILGKEAALFTVSGTMSNEVAVMVYTRPGDEVVVFGDSHIYNLETGALAALAGVQARPVPSENGLYDMATLREAVMPQGLQRPRTSLFCLENSFHLNRGLAVHPSGYRDTAALARELGIPVFMDGARLLNAAVALEMEAAELTAACDAVALCLSKGLSAPIGSVLAGPKDFIGQARKVRQRFGGGMRQAGVIAAPGVIGLREMVHRLPVDHDHAEQLRRGLEDLGLTVDRGGLLTNIVNVDVSPRGIRADEVAGYLGRQGVKVKICTGSTLRMVTHNDVQEEDVDLVLGQLAAFFG